jgi:hypothetical protein
MTTESRPVSAELALRKLQRTNKVIERYKGLASSPGESRLPEPTIVSRLDSLQQAQARNADRVQQALATEASELTQMRVRHEVHITQAQQLIPGLVFPVLHPDENLIQEENTTEETQEQEPIPVLRLFVQKDQPVFGVLGEKQVILASDEELILRRLHQAQQDDPSRFILAERLSESLRGIGNTSHGAANHALRKLRQRFEEDPDKPTIFRREGVDRESRYQLGIPMQIVDGPPPPTDDFPHKFVDNHKYLYVATRNGPALLASGPEVGRIFRTLDQAGSPIPRQQLREAAGSKDGNIFKARLYDAKLQARQQGYVIQANESGELFMERMPEKELKALQAAQYRETVKRELQKETGEKAIPLPNGTAVTVSTSLIPYVEEIATSHILGQAITSDQLFETVIGKPRDRATDRDIATFNRKVSRAKRLIQENTGYVVTDADLGEQRALCMRLKTDNNTPDMELLDPSILRLTDLEVYAAMRRLCSLHGVDVDLQGRRTRFEVPQTIRETKLTLREELSDEQIRLLQEQARKIEEQAFGKLFDHFHRKDAPFVTETNYTHDVHRSFVETLHERYQSYGDWLFQIVAGEQQINGTNTPFVTPRTGPLYTSRPSQQLQH